MLASDRLALGPRLPSAAMRRAHVSSPFRAKGSTSLSWWVAAVIPGLGGCGRRYDSGVGRSWVAAVVLVAGIGGVAFAARALADPFTAAEIDFVDAVTPLGYSGVSLIVQTGHVVCAMLDRNANHTAIENTIVSAFDDRRQSASYNASWFGQYSAYHLCPRHTGEFGNI